MSLLDLARLLLRRWPVIVVVGVLTVAAAAVAYRSAEDQYTIAASLVLEPAEEEDTVEQVSTAAALAQVLNAGEVRADIAELVPGADYDVTAEGDFVLVRAEAVDEPTARAVVEAVLDRVESELPVVAEQYGAGADRVRGEVVATPSVRGAPEEGTTVVGASVLITERAQRPNPYADGDYAGVVLLAAAQPLIRSGVLELEPPENVELGFEVRQPAPVMSLTVTSTDQSEVVRLYEATVELLQSTLSELQAADDIAQGRRTQVRPLVPSPVPERTAAAPLRPVIAVFVLGGVLTVLAALAVDAWEERRTSHGNWTRLHNGARPSSVRGSSFTARRRGS